MKRLTGAALMLGIVVVPMTWAALAAGRQNQPGLPTVARMYVLNKDPSEAVPVRLTGGDDVQPVAVMAPVALASDASVAARSSRQSWEYRQVTITAGAEGLGVINAAGTDGWEAVGTLSTGASGTVVLMKRPR